MKDQSWSRGIALLFNLGARWGSEEGGGQMGVGSQHHAPASLLLGKTLYPLYSRLGGTEEHSEWVLKILPPLGINPRTVQPVASCHTD
jgi:hypothetical protein